MAMFVITRWNWDNDFVSQWIWVTCNKNEHHKGNGFDFPSGKFNNGPLSIAMYPEGKGGVSQ